MAANWSASRDPFLGRCGFLERFLQRLDTHYREVARVAEATMDHQLKLTAKGLAVYELMSELGLTLEAACARIDSELESLRKRVDSILAESDWADVPRAMQAALESVSLFVQDAYL